MHIDGRIFLVQKLRILRFCLGGVILPVFRPIVWHVKIVVFTSNLHSGVLYTIIFHIQHTCKINAYR